MPAQRDYQTEAIIIKKTRLGEADRILTLCTPELGKIQAKAKGVRRPKSKLAGHLELITHSLVSLARGRGDLDIITGSQTINGFLTIKSDLELTSYALYASELVNQFSAEHVENRPLFELLLATLQLLAPGADNDKILRYFELHLLRATGYQPQLKQCVACRQPLTPVVNFFSPGAGGVLCPACSPAQPFTRAISVNALKVLRLFAESDWSVVPRLKLNPELAAELEITLRAYVKFLLEREVKSVAWLESLRRESQSLAALDARHDTAQDSENA